MTVYQEMNNKIVELLRISDTPIELYAAQRIEELELKNKELIARILEIIDDETTDEGNGRIIDQGIVWLNAKMLKQRIEILRGEQG